LKISDCGLRIRRHRNQNRIVLGGLRNAELKKEHLKWMSRKKENIGFSVIPAEFVPAGFKPRAGIEFIQIFLDSCFYRSDGI